MSKDWTFLKKPFWIFTHVFVGVSVVAFLLASNWQFDRLDQRRNANAEVVTGQQADPRTLESLFDESVGEYVNLEGTVSVVDSDFIRIANRTFMGQVGQHVVALAELESQQFVFVNRGFVVGDPSTSDLADFFGTVEVSGFVRRTVERGRFGVADVLDDRLAPRFDLAQLCQRSGAPEGTYGNYWLQLDEFKLTETQGSLNELQYASQTRDTNEALVTPDVLGIPELSEGSHFSYALQWLIFAALTAGFYVVILRRKAVKGAN